jgi:hypothetical protein
LPIGGPEDTLKTVYGQYTNHGGKQKNAEIISNNQLRCKIKILTKNNIDSTRLLQLIFNISDSSIQIYEEIVRNSGTSIISHIDTHIEDYIIHIYKSSYIRITV